MRATKSNQWQFISFFDGACEPRNPGGNMGIGAAVFHNGVSVLAYSKFVKKNFANSNNVAEYMAFERVMDFLINEQVASAATILIYGDSKLVVEQMNGRWQMKGGRYVEYALRCKEKFQTLKAMQNRVSLEWISRNENIYADELSKRELINHHVEFRIQKPTLNHGQ